MILAAAFPVSIVAVFSIMNRAYELDDALIYYRYIRNYLAGRGLVYNPGEYFNALTSPLHTYLALAFCGLAGSIPQPMIMLSALLTAASALGLLALFARYEARWPFLVLGAALFAALRYSYAVYGMETPLFVALCIATLLLYERRATFWLGLVGALLLLTRAEGVFLLLILGGIHLWRGRPVPPVRDLVLPVAILGVHTAFTMWYYGSPIPHTLMAKIQQGRSGLWGEQWIFFDAGYQLEFFANSGMLLAGCVGLALLGIVRLGRHDLTLVILGFLASLTVFYAALNVPAYHWYYAPCYAFGSMYVALGGAELYDRATVLGRRASIRAARLAIAILMLSVFGWHVWSTARHPVSDDTRQRAYRAVGRWLAIHTPMAASIAMVEVGIIGYYSERRIIDILGLVSAMNAESLGNRRFDEWIPRYAPDFILVHNPPWVHEQGAVRAFQYRRYHPLRTFNVPGFVLLERSTVRGDR